ncbi:MAG: prolyl endopeptidase [Gemmatimonadetes bacterium]|jgi:prolyl oligopeptidase|nr:prolyl endopeptidase [Gemmatimonadota bacterium]
MPHRPIRHRTHALAVALAVSMTVATPAAAQRIQYPVTRTTGQVDSYFGTQVADPYRWLEDDRSAEAAQWVDAQNKVTFAYLEAIPYRKAVRARLERLYNYAKFGAPFRKGENYIFSKNDGLQNQSVLYIQKGLTGTPEVLIDPNTFSTDGTSRLAGFSLSKDGKYAAYGISVGGSDWTELRVMEVATRRQLPDVIRWAKFTGAAWQGDGFYYGRYPAPDSLHAMTNANEGRQVYYHRVGTPQSADELVFEDRANPRHFPSVGTTEDERYTILSVSDNGRRKGNALFYRARGESAWRPIVPDITDDSYTVVDNVGDRLLVQTDHTAPNGMIVRWDPRDPANWTVVIGEKPDPIQAAGVAGGKLFVTYTKDVTTRAHVYSLAGRHENEIRLPGPGAAGGFGGNDDDRAIFYTYSSFNTPPSIYRYDIASRRSTLFRTPEIPGFSAKDYVTRQVFYRSKDGTRVPMFLTYRKGLKLDGNNPTLLYGYGGFNAATTPSFSALRLALLEQGFVYASANIRGGSEYGEKWHDAGTKLQKQNVFDDFIAAAEWLVANRYTTPKRLAIHGVSNGGLLVGAVANQRPELFGAVIQQAGVMDMLRFHKFTIGSAWIADYGSADGSEAEFKALRAYSPVHNIRPGTAYPATLITTADHDDRVVPAHSFKYAAALQAGQGGPAPVLIRIDTKSGHGASSTTKALEQTADLYSFVMKALGVEPKLGVVP